MSEKIRQFTQLLKKQTQAQQVVQTIWAEVVAVDWDKKTMTAKSISDKLEYYEVLLGLGSVFQKPKTGSLCLLGVLENKTPATFLIEAKEVESYEIKSDNAQVKVAKEGVSVVKGGESLIEVSDDFIAIKNDNAQVKVAKEGVSVIKDGNSLFEVLDDFMEEVNKITFNPSQGINMNNTNVHAIKQRLNRVLTT